MYAVGDEVNVPSNQIMDPVTMLHVKGEGASVGVLDTDAKLKAMEDALVFQINTIINNYGISADAWTLSVAEASGRALKIRNSALLEMRADQLPLYQEKEKELFKLIKIVNNAHYQRYGWKKIGKGAEVITDFAEIEFPEDPDVELKLDVRKSRMGLLTPGKLYMKYNPDIKDEKEAEKILLENLTKWESAKGKFPQLEDALKFILGDSQEPGEGDGDEGEE